ncbi:hypothetical protein [Cryobacterium serini]|uniref:hypothetical protein n=1 Tax=Cryobacterium serini TaxID=1259201 RepID=UPI001F547DB1|nr:hypothetical protein [Cryobacterium serini]
MRRRVRRERHAREVSGEAHDVGFARLSIDTDDRHAVGPHAHPVGASIAAEEQDVVASRGA